MHLLLCLCLLLWLPLSSAKAAAAGAFEIHVFDVGQGSSTLVRYPSGFTVLIDVRDGPIFLANAGGKAVADKLGALLPSKHVNAVVASHLDIDHIGYATRGGIWYVFNKAGFTFDTLLDRDAGVWLDGNANGKCDDWDDAGEFEWHAVGEVSGTIEKWVCWTTSLGAKRQIARPGTWDQIVPPDAGARVAVVAADGSSFAGPVADDRPLKADHTRSGSDAPGENEFSSSLVFSFGKLDFATSGDVGGRAKTNIFGDRSLDVETTLAPLIGSVEVVAINHHGSSSSTNQNFLDGLKPLAALVSDGEGGEGDWWGIFCSIA